METLLFILTVLTFGVGTALVAYIVIMGASSEIEEELFDNKSFKIRKSDENTEFFFTKKH